MGGRRCRIVVAVTDSAQCLRTCPHITSVPHSYVPGPARRLSVCSTEKARVRPSDSSRKPLESRGGGWQETLCFQDGALSSIHRLIRVSALLPSMSCWAATQAVGHTWEAGVRLGVPQALTRAGPRGGRGPGGEFMGTPLTVASAHGHEEDGRVQTPSVPWSHPHPSCSELTPLVDAVAGCTSTCRWLFLHPGHFLK